MEVIIREIVVEIVAEKIALSTVHLVFLLKVFQQRQKIIQSKNH